MNVKSVRIARIVSSNSHLDYVARVFDSLDVSEPPRQTDYGFGRFVAVESGEQEIVGVVYNSLLVNPEYANFGPRLSRKPELESFSPDFLNEQGCLLAILLLGKIGRDGKPDQSIPHEVISAGQEVRTLDSAEVERFHRDNDGRLTMKYYGHVVGAVGGFAGSLFENLLEQLAALDSSSDSDQRRLAVIRRSLAWQRTVGQMRL